MCGTSEKPAATPYKAHCVAYMPSTWIWGCLYPSNGSLAVCAGEQFDSRMNCCTAEVYCKFLRLYMKNVLAKNTKAIKTSRKKLCTFNKYVRILLASKNKIFNIASYLLLVFYLENIPKVATFVSKSLIIRLLSYLIFKHFIC